MSQQEQRKTFEIGLAMAGAVSAGAYTAGVFDFLIEALDEWEKAGKGVDIPPHRVVIKVMSGASAGAVTGALGAVSLAGGLQPKQVDVPGSGIKITMVLPTLYDTWVVRPRMVSASGGRDLLSLEDLKSEGGKDVVVRSALNANLLDDIRDGALVQPKAGPPKPYIAKRLHVYLTISNLRGIPYQVGFEGGAYGMQTHGDRMHYVLTGLGTADVPSVWADADPPLPLDTSKLHPPGPSAEWRDYANSAVASAAFPVGFAPRPIKNQTSYYTNRYLPVDLPVLTSVSPAWPIEWLRPDPRTFDFLSVDGGVINNEPFEYARSTLMKDPPKQNERDGDKADRAVLMIDPFPEPPSFLPDNKPEPDVVSVASALFPALINQARFKPSELQEAADRRVYSRFLIAPHRDLGRADGKDETYSIACGLLGGFGGFFDEGFRRHDFQLGRRNCQRFLKEVFALPEDNPVIKTWTDAAKQRFHTHPKPGEKAQYPIIPVMGAADIEVKILPWWQMSTNDFDTLKERVNGRLTKVVKFLIEAQTKSRVLRIVFKIAARFGKGRLLEYINLAMLSDLIRRNQIADWSLPQDFESEDVRNVLAELAAPAFHLRTVAGLVRTTLLPAKRIEAILAAFIGETGKPYAVWKTTHNGAAAYTLYSRKPSAARQIPIIGQAIDWFDELVVD